MIPRRTNTSSTSALTSKESSEIVKKTTPNTMKTFEETRQTLHRGYLREVSNTRRESVGEKHRKTKSDTNVFTGIIDKIEVATRRTSLTHSEATLLNAVQVGDQIVKRQTIAFSRGDIVSGMKNQGLTRSISSDFLEDTKARYELSIFIDQRRNLLTVSELKFLESLVASPGVSVEVLERTMASLLERDLYNISEDESENDEKKEAYDKKRINEPLKVIEYNNESITSLLQNKTNINMGVQRDSNFRTELWSTVSIRQDDNSDDDWELVLKDDKLADIDFELASPKSIASFFCFLTCHDDFNEKYDDFHDDEIKKEKYFNEIDFSILGTSVDDLYAQPHVLSPPLMDTLRSHMPYLVQQDNLWMKYSLIRDGASLKLLLSNIRNSKRTLLAIETYEGEVFGAFVSSPWRANGNNYYGNGESFLWRMRRSRFSGCSNVVEQAEMDRDIEVFPWTSSNRNIQLSNSKKLIVGGGAPEVKDPNDNRDWGFGLALNSDLSHGSSSNCWTFESPCLSQLTKDGMFRVANVEVWTMTPVASVKQAEQLELARAFLVENSDYFVEG